VTSSANVGDSWSTRTAKCVQQNVSAPTVTVSSSSAGGLVTAVDAYVERERERASIRSVNPQVISDRPLGGLEDVTQAQLQLFPDSIELGYQDFSRGPRCIDCDVNTAAIGEDYMVTDEVWRKANPISHGFLCVRCLERRLGRELEPGDFIDVPVSRTQWRSELLRRRHP